nr:HNH endonuclease [bacterium]
MAQKRMFDKSVIDSDNFLEMPLTTQALYFHLNMRADDDGFVDNWKTIMKIVGAKEDDIRVLIGRQFIIPFDTGVIVIRHWKINNYLQKDRKKSTRHIPEIQQLKEVNGEYFLLENDEISNILLLEENEKEIPEWQKRRDEAYKNSSLPYSFLYKIRNEFNGCECPLCKNIMRTSGHKKYLPTIQHLVPISKGGLHELDNIAVICLSCNSSIKDKEITDKLNNEEVIEKWNSILRSDKYLSRLTSGSIDKNRIDKNSIEENNNKKINNKGEEPEIFEYDWLNDKDE